MLVVLSLWSTAGGAALLSGTVTDEGEALPMAEVFVIDARSHELRGSLFSDVGGGFRFDLPVGRYHLRVSREEYADAELRDVELGADGTWCEIELLPAAFAEPVEGGESSDGDCD